jgi:hypothetical protein
MSEEAPETADAAIRGYIAAIGFTLVLVGGEMMAAKEGGRFALGAVLLIAGLPCYLAAGLWNSVKSKLSTRNLATLGMVAGDVRFVCCFRK